ncbi:EscU/YscU/HrcU family type III secretion system export apparatus switch protein [Yoonia litorea]|uniref:Flagellar biosynthetic protein FlhB n=1 Tax=Yoonia litorea TaxID=1123755 RepID=A0A1I6MUB7_9RHOB|nr:flagellar type III secretion system protein FlhB [Yoonia litorea]SFS19239.1 flagellar biosynthetic protein FlhB [Yoonia litorea]
MSENDEDSDKQYEPSAKKLEDARKKGEIARSADLTTAASYAGFLCVLLTVANTSLDSFSQALVPFLDDPFAFADLVFHGGTSTAGGFLGTVGSTLIVWFAVPAVFALVSVAAQRALQLTPGKIMPKLNRISPVSGVKNKFGAQGLFEFLKSSAKLVIFSVCLGLLLWSQIDDIVMSASLTPRQIIGLLNDQLAPLVAIVLLIALCLGVFDYLWQRSHHLRKNRMSRKEMMDELKQSEGDPLMKQQRRQRAQDIATNRMLLDVPQASVVIVNPTHFAVALKWDRGETAPTCVAKGVDAVAAQIRLRAAEHGVPVHSDPPTARALFAQVEIGAEIQPTHYKAVAAAIRFADQMRQKASTI